MCGFESLPQYHKSKRKILHVKVVTKENFNIGFTTEGLGLEYQKLVPKRVKGGVVLKETTFTIK